MLGKCAVTELLGQAWQIFISKEAETLKGKECKSSGAWEGALKSGQEAISGMGRTGQSGL